MTPPGAVGRVALPRRGAASKPRLAGRALVAPLTWDPIRIALATLMLVSIARVHTLVPGAAALRPGVLLTVLSVGFAFAMPGSVMARGLLATWPARRVGVLLALACVGAPLGLGLGASFTALTEVYLPMLVFAGLIVVAVRRTGDLRLLIGSYVVSVGILVFQAIFVWGSTEFNGFQRTASTVMYDANDLGVLFSAGLPLSLLIAQTSVGPGRIAAYACAVGIPAAIAVLGSRGGLIALIVTGAGLLVMMPRMTWARRGGFALAAVVAMALVAPEGYLTKMQTILNPGDDYNVTSETGRIAIWKRGLANLARDPLTGVGIGNFARSQWVYQQYTAAGSPIRAQSSHNTFLQVATELGIPAFLVFVSIVYGVAVGFARIRSRLPRSWLDESAERRFAYLAASYLPVAFLGWSAGAFFVSHAYLAPFYVLTAFAAGFLFLLRRETRSAGLAPSSAAPLRMRTPGR